MKAAHWLVLFLLSAPLFLAGCQNRESKATAEKPYPIKGKILTVEPAKSSVKLDHEDIPGLMKGMEMEFSVADPKLLEGLKPGDQVQGELRVESGKYLITRLEKR